MPSKVMIIVIEFMFLGINIFWALLRAHFNPRLTARAKMSLSRAQNIFMPANINSIVLLFRWLVGSSVDSYVLPPSEVFGPPKVIIIMPQGYAALVTPIASVKFIHLL